jgi:uncharacterized repeat protein (TIGR03803 family)
MTPKAMKYKTMNSTTYMSTSTATGAIRSRGMARLYPTRTATLVLLGVLSAGLAPIRAQVTGIAQFSSTGDPQNSQVVGVIAQGRDGNMYFTAPEMVANMKTSAAYRITPSGKLTLIYTFPSGVQTYSGLTLGTNGNFYGTTVNGGANGKGSVFELTPKGVLATLYSFLDENDGANPMAPPIEIESDLYGTATAGGLNNDGTVYKLTPSGKLTPLVQFSGSTGTDPVAPLVEGTDGRLYGVTRTATTYNGACIAFSVTTSGTDFTYGSYQEAYSYCDAALVEGSDGDFYSTVYTNIDGWGQVFKVTPSPSYAFTALYSFSGGADGKNPYAALLLATDGNFYGVAQGGGSDTYGTLYEIKDDGFVTPVAWTFTGGGDGAYPSTPLIQNTNGLIYGTTQNGGLTTNDGVFFRFDNGLKPFVSLVSSFGAPGATIGILGQKLTGATNVSFNGTSATFTVVSSTYMTAEVPAGATTGYVTVTIPTAALTSNKQFNVSN